MPLVVGRGIPALPASQTTISIHQYLGAFKIVPIIPPYKPITPPPTQHILTMQYVFSVSPPADNVS